jgi:predicted DNA-binding protein (UPF0251 family)
MPVTGEVFLSVEELEAIRLTDFEHLDQETAANMMEVSRQTYGRILSNARGIIGEAIVTGKDYRGSHCHRESAENRRWNI